jgi:DNA-binding response OmpR family regulator
MSKRSRDVAGKSRDTESIMVVERDVLIRMSISQYLRECGFRVVEAITGEEALKILGAGVTVHAVLAEVRLPGALDGFALAQRIRRRFGTVEVILTSGVAMAARRAGELCDQGPLKKPYHPDQLVRRLGVLFERRKRSKLT